MYSPGASSLALSLSPSSSERVRVHDENLSFSDRSSRLSSPKGLRLALSPLSPLGSSMNSNSFVHRDSSIEKRSRFSPTRRRKRRGISSLTRSMVSNDSFKEDEFSSTKKTRLDTASSPDVSTSNLSTLHEQGVANKSIILQSPLAVYDFDYHTKSVSCPTSSLVQEAYIVALEPSFQNDESAPSSDPITHQQRLRASGCPLLSFEDVILPSIIAYQQQVMRTLQAKAQGYKDSYATVAFQYGRMALFECARRSVDAIQKCRVAEAQQEEENQKRLVELMKEKRKQERLQKKLTNQQLAKDRETAKTLLMMQRQVETEKRRRDRKKNWPRNKELWTEVALLMTDLRRLEKEEKVWRDASDVLDKLESESSERVRKIQEASVEDDSTRFPMIPLEDQTINMDAVLEDCALSASRINNMAVSVQMLTAESGNVRKSLYDLYNNHHKLNGYLGVKDPKALLRALALG
jgi:hypothetical protein